MGDSRLASILALVLMAPATGCDPVDMPRADAAVDAAVEVDASRENCPELTEPQATPGDDIDGDSWATFAAGFFETYCTHCHSSEKVGATARNGAPSELNWDDEATVRANLELIRHAVGEANFMPPPLATQPTCAERQRLVRWIDAAAP